MASKWRARRIINVQSVAAHIRAFAARMHSYARRHPPDRSALLAVHGCVPVSPSCCCGCCGVGVVVLGGGGALRRRGGAEQLVRCSSSGHS
eukprot:COSAG01_NODE_1513_length_10065_cov_63.160144_14_plen_91_part_00